MISELDSNHLQTDGDQNSSPYALESNTTRFCSDFETDIDLDASVEMPPPLPYYNRHVQFVGPATLGRASSESLPSHAASAKDFMVSQRFHRSLPNLHGSRPQHNRVVGLTPEFHALSRRSHGFQWRVDEFDALLADL